ncbi:MAG: protease inhibitor I42 family protein [Micavibrio sp.]|nr:protease inhibitor I42 family protein [Micavibrio sp.]
MEKLSEQFNSIAVKKGDFFTVELPCNGASSGYLWNLDVTAGQAKVIRHDYINPNQQQDMMGFPIGGTMIDRTIMQAEEDGVIEINAEWKRPWEKATPPAKALKLKVTVG